MSAKSLIFTTSSVFYLSLLTHVVISASADPGENVCKDEEFDSSECSLPFIYQGNFYSNCTLEGGSGKPWCSLTPVYSGQWKNCTRKCSSGRSSLFIIDGKSGQARQSCIEITENGDTCFFPFLYQGTTYENCTTVRNYGKRWCSLTATYNGAWGNCIGCANCAAQYTAEGTGNGLQCASRFYYKGKWYDRCTLMEYSQPWCSIDSVYNGRWGVCIGCEPLKLSCPEKTLGGTAGARKCVFPFNYDGYTFYACTSYKYDKKWCSVDTVYKGNWGICAGCDTPEPILEDTCGIRNTPTGRIVGGEEAVPYSWPWQVALRVRYSPTIVAHQCGGTIIGAFWIITAAHCVHDLLIQSNLEIVAGTHFKEYNSSETNVQVRKVYKIFEYPNFKGIGTAPDYALIALSDPLDLKQPKVKRICLPTQEIADFEDCYITGWGSTQNSNESSAVLRQAKVPKIAAGLCESWYGNGYINSFEFCAGYEEGGKDTCQGDSGGPYVCFRKGRYELAGVTSWGNGCALSMKPGVYGRVYSVLQWIQATAKGATVEGTGNRGICEFPFEYRGVTYYSCTNANYYTEWCSMHTIYKGSWGICVGCVGNATLAPTLAPVPSYSGPTLAPKASIRLAGGLISNEGRVEVHHNGQWGTVCDDRWDASEVNVTCTSLGYSFGKVAALGMYGQGTGEIWLDDLQCKGNESYIWNCPNNGWGIHDCQHSEDVAVQCFHPPGEEIRLVGGIDVSEGRVEVKYKGVWGSVCDNSWDDTDARVVCRMLGYKTGNASTNFGSGSGPVLMNNVDCGPSQRTIWACQHDGWYATNCNHTKDVGVQCFEALDCGKRNLPFKRRKKRSDGRVVGGTEVTRNSWPWQLSLRLYDSHYCGATLLSSEWAATSAHCLDDGRPLNVWQVMAGAHKKSFYETEPQRQLATIIEVHMYPGFQYIGSAPDIALIRLSPPFNISVPEVGPICLPTRETVPDEPCYVTGWGYTEGTGDGTVLNQVEVPIINQTVCSASDWYGNRLAHFEVCAGYEAGLKDTCQGDSGGPLQCDRSGRYELAGITSWGDGCADVKKPGIYTRIYDVLNFIYSVTGL